MEENNEKKLSYKKRFSIVVYLIVLFIVAILIVTFTMVVQINKNVSGNSAMDNLQSLEERNRTLNTSLENTAKAYDALIAAKNAAAEGDGAAVSAALETLEPLKSNLSDAGLAEYAALAGEFGSR